MKDLKESNLPEVVVGEIVVVVVDVVGVVNLVDNNLNKHDRPINSNTVPVMLMVQINLVLNYSVLSAVNIMVIMSLVPSKRHILVVKVRLGFKH